MKLQDAFVVGLALGVTTGYLLNRSIIVPYVRLPPRPDRFNPGDPEIPVEISGKRIHSRLDSGNSVAVGLTKKTADFLQIKQKFRPQIANVTRYHFRLHSLILLRSELSNLYS